MDFTKSETELFNRSLGFVTTVKNRNL